MIQYADYVAKLDQFEVDAPFGTYHYVHGWVKPDADSKVICTGDPQHLILKVKTHDKGTEWEPVAACTNFESALAAGRLLSGASFFGNPRT